MNSVMNRTMVNEPVIFICSDNFFADCSKGFLNRRHLRKSIFLYLFHILNKPLIQLILASSRHIITKKRETKNYFPFFRGSYFRFMDSLIDILDRGFQIFPSHTGNMGDRNRFGTNCLAFRVIRAVSEKLLIHLENHVQSPSIPFRLSLWQQSQLRDFRAGKQRRG